MSDIFDPDSLIRAARAQHPSDVGLVEALRQCTRVFCRTEFYIYFVDPADSNKPGSAWQHRESIRLQDEENGEVLVDLLIDGSIGGIELLEKLMQDTPEPG